MSAPFSFLTEYGSTEREPMLFIRGLPADNAVPHLLGRTVEKVFIRGALRERHVFAVGRPDAVPDNITMSALADWYADLIEERFGGRVALMGISTGSSVALQLAVDHPDRVSALVIVAGAATLGDQGREIQSRYVRLLENRNHHAGVELSFASLGIPGSERWGRLLVNPAPLPAYRKSLIALVLAEETFDVVDRVNQITAPTLILAGGRDPFYPSSLARETVSRISNARLIVYPRASHVGLAFHPRFARDIGDFLHSLDHRDEGPMPHGAA